MSFEAVSMCKGVCHWLISRKDFSNKYLFFQIVND
jgi:hypothetical protein